MAKQSEKIIKIIEQTPEREQAPAPGQIVLLRAAALGNGTREAGFILGSLEVPAEGVTPYEMRTVLLNPDLYEIR